MDGDTIRQSFLDFFQARGHQLMPSASLVPAGDPTLLFTSAGMVPFKHFFTGESVPSNRRLTSSQKCFRTGDIDEVGNHKHLTFFEMLGNFSIGDYFKREAITWAWEFVTQVLKLPPERLYATIYQDDDEAFQLWHEVVGLSPERIYRYGVEENWWPQGPSLPAGPCGPDSEIHFDFGGEQACGQTLRHPSTSSGWQAQNATLSLSNGGASEQGGEACHPNHNCKRFLEVYNLVFMQFYQDTDGKQTPLPRPSIDTGMGLDRVAAVLQNKDSVYETDLFWPIVKRVCKLSGKTYGEDQDTDFAIRVVAEHGRGAPFLIADGVVPGNEGRGYVLRRIIRRAIRYGRKLGLEGPFLEQVAQATIERFGKVYPELVQNQEFILRVLRLEEERFEVAVTRGLEIVEGYIAGLQTISAEDVEAVRRVLAPAIQAQSSKEITLSQDAAPVLFDLEERVAKAREIRERGPIERYGAYEGAYELSCSVIIQALHRLQEAAETWGKFVGLSEKLSWDIRVKPEKVKEAVVAFQREVRQIPGARVFQLWDTYGFPPELTQEIAREHGLEVDMEGFQREMEEQRKGARAASAFTGAMEVVDTYENLGVGQVAFLGYEHLTQQTVVAAILVDNAPTGHAAQGQKVEVVLQETPFYPQGGGQVGDAGYIIGPNGKVRVEDTQAPVAGLIVHRGVVVEGEVSLGDQVEAKVDPDRRAGAARHHTGTHLLHASLRQVLGPHVKQAGSLVAPDRLRFDFSHVTGLSREELLEVQGLVNRKVLEDLSVQWRETTYPQAVKEGALAFFGDKYGDQVRVVDIGNGGRFSYEVCGGTHVGHTGEVGPLFVLGESSIGGGMRRVEAVTGHAAERLFIERSDVLEAVSRKLKTPVSDLEVRLDAFIEESDQLRKRLVALERELLRREAQELLQGVQDVDGIKVLAGRIGASSVDAMRETGDWLKARLSSGVLVLGAVLDGRPMLVAMVTSDLVEKGLHAGNIAREAAGVMGGGGGGRPEMAQAGGKQADKLEEALQRVPEIVRQEAKP